MHGTVHRYSESCRSLRRSDSRHMRSAIHPPHSATTRTNISAADDHHSSVASSTTTNTSTADSFFKDDRKVNVGDCALFKPSQDSPPFIGLIRCLKFGEGSSLQIGVNWLYRPAEIKLVKGTLLDSAPNEVFYSFHEDEIPAATLLHPCKVAFLPKGVELPAGALAFVCRRVYDIANRCLWWLTDQDYINERQEEVDLLLHKTKAEMHATLQPGDRSPKQVISPSSTAKLKPGCDSGQNSGTSYPSHMKGKKRERGDSGADIGKRERSLRPDDGDHVHSKPETYLKSEIAQITENGGVTNLDGVEKLILLMQSNKMERNRDLLSRSILVGVMAATDKFDCLNGFVQLRGLPILDEWLQDIQKGKIGDGCSLKDGDKSVEEFLLVLLRALDKLPINLNALQMCNIGRSVNHLRSHKNLEIQRKARSLVDTWKKGVEAEMISIDTKTGSTQGMCIWTSKSRPPEVSHGGSRTPTGNDVAMAGSVNQNFASKNISAKSSLGESNIKSDTSSPEPLKSASSPASGNEGKPKASVRGTPVDPIIREDRSSSSNQPNYCNQFFSGQEDEKSFSTGLTTVCKISNSNIRNRKISGFSGGSGAGSPKETSTSKGSSAHRNIVSEKSESASVDKGLEVPYAEVSSHNLIVKIPNRLRSPSHGVHEKSMENSSIIGSQASSEVLLDKHEQLDQTSKAKSDSNEFNVDSDMNMELWQSSDFKDLLIESGEGSGSPAALPDEEQSMNAKKTPANQPTSILQEESSFEPVNALIKSCVNYSIGNPSVSEDEVGVNLLACVATRETPRFSATDSAEISTHTAVETCIADEAKLESSPERQLSLDVDCDDGKKFALDGSSFSDDKLHKKTSVRSDDDDDDDGKQAALNGCPFSEDRFHKKTSVKSDDDLQREPSTFSEALPAGGVHKHTVSSSTESKKSVGTDWRINEKISTTSVKLPISSEKVTDGQYMENIHEEEPGSTNLNSDGACNCRSEEICLTEEKAGSALRVGKPTPEFILPNNLGEGDDINDSIQESNSGTNVQQIVNAIIKPELTEKADDVNLPQDAYGQNSVLDGKAEVNLGEPDKHNAKSSIDTPKLLNFNNEVTENADIESHKIASFCSTSSDLMGQKETCVEKIKVAEHISLANSECFGFVNQAAQPKVELEGSLPASLKLDETETCDTNAVEVCSFTAKEMDANTKIKFDLNEGFSVDEGKFGEPIILMSSLPTAVHTSHSVPFSVNSVPAGHSACITVTSAAKGPFVPPEDLMRSEVELGWKGSAATSAFRPAEPRKFLEMPVASSNITCSDGSTNKNTRILFDIDLNVPDERVIQEMASRDSALAVDSTTNVASKHVTLLNEAPSFLLVRSSGGMDLDLNREDETNDNAHLMISSNYQKRDFDLNDGPVADIAINEQFSICKKVHGEMPSQLASSGIRINNTGVRSFPSWFPPGNTSSTAAIPSILTDRCDQPFPVFPPGPLHKTFVPYAHDHYQGPVLSSSPAVQFPSSHFPFPIFPFGSTFPLPSATSSVGANSHADSSSSERLFAPPVNSQFLGPVGSVASHFPGAYVVNIPNHSCSGMLENDRRWGNGGLDLNAGPGAMEIEAREESSSQQLVAGAQAVAEERSWLLSASVGTSKRKEPDGALNNESVRYKQFLWQ